jgi:hypothetical protein
VLRIYSIALALVLNLLAASASRADTRVTIHDFFGPSGESLRADVEKLLRQQPGVTLVPKSRIDSLARAMSVDPFSPLGRKALARELQLSAWVTGMVKKNAGKLRLTLVVYDGAENTRLGRTVLQARDMEGLRGAVKRELWSKSKEALALALAPLPEGRGEYASDAPRNNFSTPPGAAETQSNPAAAEPSPAPSSSAPGPEASFMYEPPPGAARPDSPVEPEPKRKHPESMRLYLGIGSPYRSFVYSDPITSSLGDYQLSGVPMFDMNVAYYPMRAFTDNWTSWLGIDAAAQVAGSSESVDRDGNKFKSRYDAYRIGMRGRIPVGKHYVSAFTGYAVNRLLTTGENKEAVPPTPNIDYRMIRSGAGGELSLPRAISLGIDAAWMYVLSAGEIGSWFPRATVGGMELAMYATYALSRHFYARVSATYQRNFFDFHSKPGDERAAGGATDQFLTASASLGVGL